MIIYTYKKNDYAFNIIDAAEPEFIIENGNAIAGGIRTVFKRKDIEAYDIPDEEVPSDATVDGLYNGEVVDGEATEVKYFFDGETFTLVSE